MLNLWNWLPERPSAITISNFCGRSVATTPILLRCSCRYSSIKQNTWMIYRNDDDDDDDNDNEDNEMSIATTFAEQQHQPMCCFSYYFHGLRFSVQQCFLILFLFFLLTKKQYSFRKKKSKNSTKKKKKKKKKEKNYKTSKLAKNCWQQQFFNKFSSFFRKTKFIFIFFLDFCSLLLFSPFFFLFLSSFFHSIFRLFFFKWIVLKKKNQCINTTVNIGYDKWFFFPHFYSKLDPLAKSTNAKWKITEDAIKQK